MIYNKQTINYSFIRKPEVLTMLGISNSTLYGRIQAGLLPPSFSLGNRAVAWKSTELEAVMNSYASGQSIDEIKQLVKELVESRQQFKAMV